jgi:hypothetical protein
MSHRRHDPSPGDARKPFSDVGGPEAKHAQTHDLRREELSNAKGPTPEGEDFAADIAPATPDDGTGGHADESRAASGDKRLHQRLDDLDGTELDQLAVLETGARLHQGGTYVDLNDAGRQPFAALGGQEAGPEHRYVAKRDTDHELWNRLVGQGREVEVERPAEDQE